MILHWEENPTREDYCCCIVQYLGKYIYIFKHVSLVQSYVDANILPIYVCNSHGSFVARARGAQFVSKARVSYIGEGV